MSLSFRISARSPGASRAPHAPWAQYRCAFAGALQLAILFPAFNVVAEEIESPEIVSLKHAAMGTQFEFTLYARPGDTSTGPAAEIAQEAFDAIDDLENRISSWIENSQTTYVNNHAAEHPVRVGADLLDLIRTAKEFHRKTGGAFDCSVGPLIALYGFHEGEGETPAPEALATARALVGMDKVRVDAHRGMVAFDVEGMRLDFGGIGKGLALDAALDILKRRGIERALLHGGTSTVVALGTPPEEPGWKVHIRHPYNEEKPLATVLLRDESLSTSGCYGAPGQICDILDPRTGLPVAATLSATVIASTATETDALSTSFLVMGLEETRRYCETNPGVRAIIAPVPDTEELAVYRIGMNEQR